jgi:diaminohydroxyphosphoribosylaminopyrimidine deaminase/5-amino-6-(5-phosphoribosylamino)uracil reductase
MSDARFMRMALRFARRGHGLTSPNPMVGAVLVKGGKIIGRGWHRGAGLPHAEVEALRDAQRRGHRTKGATLYVTLEPCCTHGRTPPCTEAIIAAGIKRVVIGAIDPNPKHAGTGLKILGRAGVAAELIAAPRPSLVLRTPSLSTGERDEVRGLSGTAKLAADCARLNEAFNHWIVHRTPFVTVKAAMTLDGKIATASGESKWITGEQARACGMKLRVMNDAILVGVNTVLTDDPGLTIRSNGKIQRRTSHIQPRGLRRIVLDSMARTPLNAKVVNDELAALTTIVVSQRAPKKRVVALAKRVNVLIAPTAKPSSLVTRRSSHIDLRWLLKKLGSENVTRLLVEGGGEVNASFLLGGLTQRVAFFYAPKILGGRDSRKAVAGRGVGRLADIIRLRNLQWRQAGKDLLLLAQIQPSQY